ncbi:MAG TPA: hypothetical protein VFB06_30220 [Streptosporangiaceae bacterium]|nr:hypothetical protein [Streptosporangiaceae bacterium]
MWTPRDYLYHLNKAAIYAATRGMPLMLIGHIFFLVKFIRALLKREPGGANDVAAALFNRWPRWSRRLIAWELANPYLPSVAVLYLLLLPYLLPLSVVQWQTTRSVVYSSFDVFRRGVRLVPPLITAVVVVFVTSDAWRILGSGSTNRFWAIVGAFLGAGLLLVVRWNCWDDLDATPEEAAELLGGIRRRHPLGFDAFTKRDIASAPIERRGWLCQIWVYTGYWMLSAFALVVTAVLVTAVLVLIGVILINQKETTTLAGNAHVYWPWLLPGGLVITRQLLQLSASLGAFGAFFLVAAQHPDDRRAFVRNALLRFRRVLLVYSIYVRARSRAAELTAQNRNDGLGNDGLDEA